MLRQKLAGFAVAFCTVTVRLSAQVADPASFDRYQRSLDSLVPALLEELPAPGAAVGLTQAGRGTGTVGWQGRPVMSDDVLRVVPRRVIDQLT